MARELALLVLVLAGGCKRDGGSEPAQQPPLPAEGERPLAEKPYFRIDAAPQPACTAGSTCEARLVLRALGDYKVNEEYPFKFVADAAAGLTIEGTGMFSRQDVQTGTMTVRFRSDAPGTRQVSGTFKLSVCTEANCEIEDAKIAFDVTAS
jgi:hypothetical protein